jgi:ribosome recycling factor
MELKDILNILISLSASLAAMSFGFGGQRERIRQIIKDIDEMGEKHRTQVNPVLQDIQNRLIRVESETTHFKDRFDRIEKTLETILAKL